MKKGFTLVELLIVVAIIGLLGGAILISTSNAKQRSVNKSFVQYVKSAQGNLTMVCNANPATPITTVSLAMIITAMGLSSTDVTVTGTCNSVTVVVPASGGRFQGATSLCKAVAGGVTLHMFNGVANRGTADCQ